MSSNKNPGLNLDQSLRAFFFERLEQINRSYLNPLSTEAIHYSSEVMNQLCDAQRYFDYTQGKVREKTLGLKLLEAAHLGNEAKKRTLKDIGDTSLLLCGYFSESLKKKLVDVRYYHHVGMSAYEALDNLVPQVYEVPSFYRKLSNSFSTVTHIMSEISKEQVDLGPKALVFDKGGDH